MNQKTILYTRHFSLIQLLFMYFLELLIFSEGFVKFLVLIEFRKKFK